MSHEQPYSIRRATNKDVPFIFNSWLKSYRNSSFANQIDNNIFFPEHHKVIENILQEFEVLVACDNNDSNQIYGFICAGKTDGIFTLHYIYVKHPFRKMGVAKSLLNSFDHTPETGSVYTHHTRVAQILAPRYNMIYHPYIALNKTPKKV